MPRWTPPRMKDRADTPTIRRKTYSEELQKYPPPRSDIAVTWPVKLLVIPARQSILEHPDCVIVLPNTGSARSPIVID